MYEVADEYAGGSVTCARCQTRIGIPDPSERPREPSEIGNADRQQKHDPSTDEYDAEAPFGLVEPMASSEAAPSKGTSPPSQTDSPGQIDGKNSAYMMVCPGCEKEIEVLPEHVGKRIVCSLCARKFTTRAAAT